MQSNQTLMTTSATKKQCLLLDTVSDAVANVTDLAGVREQLKHFIGQRIIIHGAPVLKKITRHEHLKLFIAPGDSPLTVFAEFTEAKEAKRLLERKIRKSSNISVIGELVSFGRLSVCLNNCRLVDGD